MTAPTATNGRHTTKKRGQLLAETIASEIATARLEPGTPFGQEVDLIERYGVSRGVFREAVRLLEHQSIASMQRGNGGGLIVAQPGAEATAYAASLYLKYRQVEHVDLFDTRNLLEHAVIDRVLERPQARARIEQHLDRERTATTSEQYGYDFHVLLAGLTGDPVLEFVVDVVCRVTHELAPTATSKSARAAKAARAITLRDEHLEIGTAILEHDAPGAHATLDRHLRLLAQVLSEGQRTS